MQKLLLVLLFSSLLLLGCISAGATSETTPNPSIIVSPTPTATPSVIVLVTVTPTATPSASAAASPSPSAEATPSPTVSVEASPTVSETPSVAASPSAAAEVVEVQMVMQKFIFQPEQVKVKLGQVVRLSISVPAGDTTHGIGIPEFGVSQTVNAGETKTVEFTANKAGTFSFFCNVFCGSGHSSMRGSIVVE